MSVCETSDEDVRGRYVEYYSGLFLLTFNKINKQKKNNTFIIE